MPSSTQQVTVFAGTAAALELLKRDPHITLPIFSETTTNLYESDFLVKMTIPVEDMPSVGKRVTWDDGDSIWRFDVVSITYPEPSDTTVAYIEFVTPTYHH